MTTADLTRVGRTAAGRPRARDVDRHVGGGLRARRLALGLTQRELAGALDITYQRLLGHEAGASPIGVGRLLAAARALGVEPEYFFEGFGAGGPARPPSQPR